MNSSSCARDAGSCPAALMRAATNSSMRRTIAARAATAAAVSSASCANPAAAKSNKTDATQKVRTSDIATSAKDELRPSILSQPLGLPQTKYNYTTYRLHGSVYGATTRRKRTSSNKRSDPLHVRHHWCNLDRSSAGNR